jgi:hypothetical protein
MAHLWVNERAGVPGWSPVPLDGDVAPLGDAAALLRHASSGPMLWLLVGPPTLRVNGESLAAGIRVLRDGDELCVAGSRMFFSSESLTVVEPFAGDLRPVRCARCKLEIVAGAPAVRCPACSVWHHQSDETPCFTYAPRCALCDQPTALDAGFRFTPEAL